MNQQAPSARFRLDITEAVLLSTMVTVVFLLPQWRYWLHGVLGLGDEGLLWYVSQRTAMGELPIRDYFSYDPGRYYWSAFLFKILRGDGLFDQIMADDLFGLIGLFISYLVMCRSGISRPWRIATLVLLGVVLGFPRHKIYEQTLSLVAAASATFVLMDPAKWRRWFYFGVATGLAAFFGRNSGVYFVTAATMTAAWIGLVAGSFPRTKDMAAYIPGVLVGYAPMLALVMGSKGFGAALWESILYTPKWQIPVPVPFLWRFRALGLYGKPAILMSLLFVLAPLAYVLLLLYTFRSFRTHDRAQLLVVGASISGVCYLHHAFSHAEFGHLAQALPPLLVAGGAFCCWLFHGRKGLALVSFIGLAGFVVASWLPYEPGLNYFRFPGHYTKLAIQGRQFEVLKGDAQLMLASDAAYRRCGSRDGSFLAIPTYPGLYAYLNTRAPFRDLYLLSPRSEEFQKESISALVKSRTSVALINENADGERRLSQTYPLLLHYVLTNFKSVDETLPHGAEMYENPTNCKTTSEESARSKVK
jgi:hypothetical protein